MTLFRTLSLAALSAVSLAFFLGVLSVGHAQTSQSCSLIQRGSALPAGFAAPYSFFSSSGQLLIDGTCSQSGVAVSVGTGSSNQYIYEQGYAWRNGWQPVSLSGAQQSGAWFLGSAEGTLMRSANELAEPNFFVAYVCEWQATQQAWRCGCQDQACAQPSWQLQAYRVDDASGTNGGVATDPSDASTVVREMQGDEEVLVENLDTVWDIRFLPDGSILATERAGRVVHIAQGGTKTTTEIARVNEAGEAGLYGLDLHPNFAQNNWVYLFYHNGSNGQIERYTFANGRLTNPEIIRDDIPGGSRHAGGGLRFGPDGLLYIGVGELAQKQRAQDTNIMHGKIVRLNDDGSVPADNPFNNEVWSYGHRNTQGLVFDPQGRLWASEHGPSGDDAPQGYDEINLIERGGNYGWPTVWGSQSRGGMISPAAVSGTGGQTWAPTGIAYWENNIFLAGLRGRAIIQFPIEGNTLGSATWRFKNEYGRIRAVELGPDGMMYLGTSNGDQVGRRGGTPDQIIRVDPEVHFR